MPAGCCRWTETSTLLRSPTSLAQVLVQRFEGLLDRILRSKAYPAAAGTRGGAAAATAGGGPGRGGGSGKGAGAEPELILPVRSLATSFWALGNMRYPLTSEQLDKIAGGRFLSVADGSARLGPV